MTFKLETTDEVRDFTMERCMCAGCAPTRNLPISTIRKQIDFRTHQFKTRDTRQSSPTDKWRVYCKIRTHPFLFLTTD